MRETRRRNFLSKLLKLRNEIRKELLKLKIRNCLGNF